MKLKTTSGLTVDIDNSVILAAAGAIYASRRKRFGGPPLHAFHCRWCHAEVRGRVALDQHERGCSQQPSADLTEFTGADLVPWTEPFEPA
jgi:hypothetical protein